MNIVDIEFHPTEVWSTKIEIDPSTMCFAVIPQPLRLLRKSTKGGGAVVALANSILKFLPGVVH